MKCYDRVHPTNARRRAMERKHAKLLILAVLSVVFTIAFTLATVEAPRIISRLIPAFFPDYNPAIEFELIEELLAYLRPIGYACIVVVIA